MPTDLLTSLVLIRLRAEPIASTVLLPNAGTVLPLIRALYELIPTILYRTVPHRPYYTAK